TGEEKDVQLGSPRRLNTIYRANLRSARAAGQWERAQRTKKSHPYLLYELGPSEQHRPEHVAWAGVILPVDDPWWQTHMPPNGWGCKCRVRQVSKREHERLVGSGKYLTERPAEDLIPWTNKRTGEVMRVDRGLDPAWANNPGQARVRVLREQLTQKVETTDQRYAHAAVKNVTNSPVLDHWMAKPEGELPVGIIDRSIQTALQSKSQVVRLSVDTLDKQSRSHAELTADHYRLLPELIHRGAVIRQDEQRLAMFIQLDDRWHKAVIKADRDGGKLYRVSYHKAKRKEVRREMSRGKVLRALPRK
ncbi:MAG: phage head morphogenesis protein, partial [Gammaproteobacteria bacterium]|nr:phage head morphogenesis protein [Gammaproteobacteria bacterium]